MTATDTSGPLQGRLDAAARHLRGTGLWIRDRLRPLLVSKNAHRAWLIALGVVVVIVLGVTWFLHTFNWDRARGPLARYASARLHRTVAIDGHMRVHLLTWSPTVTLEGLRVSQPDWAGRGDMIALRKATVSVRLIPLLRGQIDLPLIDLEQPDIKLARAPDGRTNWTFGDGAASGKPLKLPPIRNFIIDNGHLRYADSGRKLFLTGTIDANETLAGPYARGFRLHGRGSVNRNPFSLDVTGGPLINIDRSRPYPFVAKVRGGATHIAAKGVITRPFDLGTFNTSLKISGADLANLYYLSGITLPNTPRYSISGRLTRDGALYKFQDIGGKIGDSDIGGSITVDMKTRRPDLVADLHSRVLNFDDLMTIFGGAPANKAVASPEQLAVAKTLKAQQRLLPDAPLQVARLRSMDARLTYRARAVRSQTLPVRTAAVDLVLKDGILDIKPFSLGLVSGQVDGIARIDARKDTPVTDLDARLRGVGIDQFIKAAGQPISGAIQARATLHGTGLSVHRTAANADGTITVVVPHGEVRQAFAELLGVNAGKGLYLLLSKDPRKTDLRCAVANFKVKGGVARVDNMVFDTGVVVTKGRGEVNLGSERMKLVVEGRSKKPRLLHLWMPITLSGPLVAPKVGVQPGGAAAQAGFGLALGALVNPLAAILPFVDPGLGKDADCAGLLAEAAAGPAPVKAPLRTAAAAAAAKAARQ